ncbi:MAG: S8 family serine peptidase [Micromonosporaceae bacterium]|nr:S8 family serine peptidase [Micromonosporaceae bacterium]
MTVAVLDTGVDATHPDLEGSVLKGIDAWSSAKDGRTDHDGHGTAVASLVAGHGHGAGGSSGILGVAPKAKILPITIWEKDWNKAQAMKDMGTGIRYAVDRGADVICIATTGTGSTALEEAVNYALGKGVPIVAGAGNKPDHGPGVPASYSGVIGVSGSDEQGRFASSISVSGHGISVAAPAVNIPYAEPERGYGTGRGTSLSTGLVSGIAALLKAKYPTITASQMLELLEATADKRGGVGYSQQLGYGIVDPIAALTKGPASLTASASASASAAASSPAAGDAKDGSGSSASNRVLVGVAIFGGFTVVIAILVISLVGLARRRRQDSLSQSGSPGPLGPPGPSSGPSTGPPGQSSGPPTQFGGPPRF